ncbi:MAG: OsmC-like protein [bacterium ADurb.Bin478]|nr:MAG: OsmC-like protein [bacterium ADurb.Bin478]
MDAKITFPGGLQVNAEYGPFTIVTNQDGTAPAPFTLFLASLGTCAGIYALSFCKQRGLNSEGLEILQRTTSDPETHMITEVALEIKLPEDFPEKYRSAIVRAVDQCAVKKHLLQPPKFSITTR